MTLHGDICAVLNDAHIAVGGAHPQFLPAGSTATEYIVVRRPSQEPLPLLQGYAGGKSTVVLEFWSLSKARAGEMADAGCNAIDAAAATVPSLKTAGREPFGGEDFEPEVMALVEIRQYGIWQLTAF